MNLQTIASRAIAGAHRNPAALALARQSVKLVEPYAGNMRNMRRLRAALALAFLLLAGVLSGCSGVRAEIAPVTTPAPAPTPVVIIVREPAPAPAQAESTLADRLPAYLIAGGLIAIALGLLAVAIAIKTRKPARSPERSQLNEAPTYLPPLLLEDEPALRVVFPPGYEWLDKIEYLTARGLTREQAAAALKASEPPRQLRSGR